MQAFDKARRYLKTILKTSCKETSRLPGYRTLARAAGVAPGTMLRALRALQKSGDLISMHGSGTYAGAHRSLPEAIPARELVWEQVHLRIEKDILAGQFSGCFLPSIKELCVRYGASYATLSKCLRKLDESGRTSRLGNRWKLSQSDLRHGMATLCFISRCDQVGNFPYDYDRWLSFFRRLEWECTVSNLKLKIIQYRRDFNLQSDIYSLREPIIGYVGFLREISDLEFLLPRLAHRAEPVAVFCDAELGSTNISTGRSSVPTRYYFLDEAFAARTIADAIIRAGHKRCAYLGSGNRFAWSVGRAEEIRRELTSLGNARSSFKVFRTPASGSPNIPEKGNSLPPHLYKKINSFLATSGSTVRVSADFATAIAYEGTRNRFRTSLCEMVEQGMLDCKATVWVCENDFLATEFMRVCQFNRVRVPQDCSVISFDDSPIAIRYQLASYNFNLTALASEMIAFVRRPELFKVGPDPVLWPGKLLHRNTLGPPRNGE